MSIIKKAPAIKTREVHLEEPVNELLEDYARFIESTPDHVLNAALKKVLWRDQGGLNGSVQHWPEVYSQESQNPRSLAAVDSGAGLFCPGPIA